MKSSDNIVFFDGVCNLCNATIDVLINIDKEAKLKFASLQSDFAKNNIPKELIGREDPDSIVFYSEGMLYNYSTAVLKICIKLGFPYNILAILLLLPKPLRDIIYKFIAKNRYKWFGKKSTCRLPTAEERSRFME